MTPPARPPLSRAVSADDARGKIREGRRLRERRRFDDADHAESVSVGDMDEATTRWLADSKRPALWSGLIVYPRGRQLHALRDGKKAPLEAADEDLLPEIVRGGRRYWHRGDLVIAAESVAREGRLVKVVVKLNYKRRLKVDDHAPLFAPWNIVWTMGYVLPYNLTPKDKYYPIDGG